ncbi:MAG: tRNA pseudouridine(38-40) synthase TruA [Rickettsiales bacterium]|jgi:tRNA pseudouridine38-40 synthase|nr:tRNA pseudouridine(38-40) synthase TruA [Rickettsiales bacterium]
MRYRLSIEYDGTNYSGWQRQGQGLSIQEVIEDCIFELSGERVELVGSGRTDAGVHALGQVAHFDLKKNRYDGAVVVQALNYYLCKLNRTRIRRLQKLIVGEFGRFYRRYGLPSEQDIVIRSCDVVGDDFHARFSSKMRHYRYVIKNTRSPLAIWRNRVWQVSSALDVDYITAACRILVGLHDFSSFRDSQCQALSPLKTISDCKIYRIEDDLVIFDVSARSFLHHMVRNIIGTLKDVGRHRIDIDEFRDILESGDRKRAGVNAPACGLYFVGVDY